MMTGIVGKEMARTNRNLLVWNVLILVGLGLAGFLARNFLSNVFAGPKAMTMEEVARIQNPGSVDRYWVHVKPDPQNGVVWVGYRPEGRNTTMTYYYFFKMPKGFLIITNGTQDLPDEFDAVIGGHDSQIDVHVIPEVRGDVRGPILPVVLEIQNLRIGAYIGIPIWLGLLGLALWNLSKALTRMGNPARHPLAVALARFGPPEEIAVGVDAEMQTSANTTGKIITTTSWLMRKTMFTTHLVYLGDVIWAYMKETKTKSHGVTTGTTYATVVCDRHGTRLEVPMKMAQVQQVLADIQRAVPWAIVGFDSRLAGLWPVKKRAEFLAIIDQRKAEFEAQQQAAARNVQPPPVQ